MVEKEGEIDFRVHGKLYLVENASYEECPFCGEKVLSPEISEVLYQKIENGEFVVHDHSGACIGWNLWVGWQKEDEHVER